MTNDGKLSEELFEKKILLGHNNVFVYRFEDHAKINFGKLQVNRIVPDKPSDYLVTIDGETFYAEVKSTKNPRFPFANLKRGQWRAGTKQVRAGGKYFVYIHFLTSNSWYKVPFQQFLTALKKSFTEEDLKECLLRGWKPLDIK